MRIARIEYCYMVTIGTITHKNQLTIPKSFLEGSDLDGVKRVILERKGTQVFLKPLKSSVSELAGSLHKPGRKFAGIEKEQEAVRKIIARQISRQGK